MDVDHFIRGVGYAAGIIQEISLDISAQVQQIVVNTSVQHCILFRVTFKVERCLCQCTQITVCTVYVFTPTCVFEQVYPHKYTASKCARLLNPGLPVYPVHLHLLCSIVTPHSHVD